MKCQNCGSENVSPDLAITHQELIKKDGECVNILADLCKDCGTVRRYVKDKDDEYTSREEYSQKKEESLMQLNKMIAKEKRIAKLLFILVIITILGSFASIYFLASLIMAKVLCIIALLLALISFVLS